MAQVATPPAPPIPPIIILAGTGIAEPSARASFPKAKDKPAAIPSDAATSGIVEKEKKL
jgi:hypothetical protein